LFPCLVGTIIIWARFLLLRHTPVSARLIMRQCDILTNNGLNVIIY